MEYSFAGLPLHVLLVHAVIVLTPLLALALIVIAAWPAARRVLWLPVLIGTAVLLALGLITIEAGEWLQQRVPPAPLIQAHTAQGRDIVPWLVALLAVAVAIAAWAVAERRRQRNGTTADAASSASSADQHDRGGRGIRVTVGALMTVAALVIAGGSTTTLVRIGEAGSRAVWQGSFSEQPLGD